MSKPRLGIFSLTGCAGDQLQILNMEDDLLQLAGNFTIVDFQEGSSFVESGPVDVALVEGSVSTEHDKKKLMEIRERSKLVVAFGNCATEGCIQAMKNNQSTLEERLKEVYGVEPGFFDAVTPKPIREYVKVDLEIPGCPVEKTETLRAITSLLIGSLPNRYTYPVCVECKINEYPCVITEYGKPCLGPLIKAGCDARCPGLGLDCIGCRGPVEGTENFAAEYKMLLDLGYTKEYIIDKLRLFSGEISSDFLGGEDDE